MDLDQEIWRNIVTLQHRLTSDQESLEEYSLDEESPSDTAITRQAEQLWETFGVGGIDDARAESAVDRAVRLTARGEYASAYAELDEVFTTVCRKYDPESVDVDEDHQSACFLCYEDSPSVSDSSEPLEANDD